MIRLALLLLLAAMPARAEEVVAALSQNRVSITANFDGSNILIFGAVKREAPPPSAAPLEVVITVSGPSSPITVRRKAYRYGIWVNADELVIDRAPSFYAIATSGPLSDILTETEDLRYKISVPRAIRSVGVPDEITDAESFTEALIRIRSGQNLYQVNSGTVKVIDGTLFDTEIRLPSNLTEGRYTTRIFLTRDGRVIDEYETEIDVSKVGLEKFLFTLAHEQPLYYGLLSLFIAIIAGWSASAVFRYIRG